jgi:excisionase family DNA binding protein
MRTPLVTKYTRLDSNILNSSDVCELLGISYSTLQKWISQGEIRILTKVGGVNYFSKKALNEKFHNQLFIETC